MLCGDAYLYMYIYNIYFYLDGVEINKEYASLIENDTLSVCKESHNDKRVFITTDSSLQRSANTITTTSSPSSSSSSSSSQHQSGKPIIYFVTPTYPR